MEQMKPEELINEMLESIKQDPEKLEWLVNEMMTYINLNPQSPIAKLYKEREDGK